MGARFGGCAAFHSLRLALASLKGRLFRSMLFSFATTSRPFLLIVRSAVTDSLSVTYRSPSAQ